VLSGLPHHPPITLSNVRAAELREEVADLLRARDAVLVAHYYTDGAIQDLAEQTGGCVSDSLEMARFGRDSAATTLVVAGVRFMGETAKILSPEKRVLMPTLDATCSLDLGCPIDEFRGVLRRASRPHGGRVCEHLGCGEGALGLGCHQQYCRADHRASGGPRRKNSVGTGPSPRRLSAPENRRRHVAVEWRLHRA